MKSVLTTKNVFIVLCVIVFAVGLWGSFSESAQLFFIPRDFSQLSKMAHLTAMEGRVIQKLVSDVLWYPMKDDQSIYLGDSVETGKDSSVQFEFDRFAKGNIKIGSESFVQMRLTQNKPLIMLFHGDVDVSGDVDDEIYVSSGISTERVQIRKGQTTKVKKTEDGNLEVKVQKTDIRNDQGKEEIGQSHEKWVSSSQVKEDSPKLPHEKPLKYPYPANQTIFLQSASGKITLFPEESCVETCELRVVENEKNVLPPKSFRAGERVFYEIKYEAKENGAFSWTFKDGFKVSSGVFFIRPFSNEEMKKALSLKYPVEIMSGL